MSLPEGNQPSEIILPRIYVSTKHGFSKNNSATSLSRFVLPIKDARKLLDELNHQTISWISYTKAVAPTSVRNRTKAATAVATFNSRR